MTIQSLNAPFDITWRRLAYSADMMATGFGDSDLPPKWRPSMTLYYYLVPAEETAESYPDHRVVYLKLDCSITGWNPDEELEVLDTVVDIDDLSDDAQKSVFEAIAAGSGATYARCTSAISQIAIFPRVQDDVPVDNYPYIIDFEPKKRELYETRTETGEALSTSAENINVNKGMTTVDKTEREAIHSAGVEFGISAGPLSIGGSQSGKTTTTKATDATAVDMRTTDTSRERREMTSFSTTLSQMYQLFNGYHAGTNRVVFYMKTRPHNVSSMPEDPGDPRQKEHNLREGNSGLEGQQGQVAVALLPANLSGFCVQASLDTGHTVDIYEFGDGRWEDRRLIVTRRTIKNCGVFGAAGDFIPEGVPVEPGSPWVVWEDELVAPVAVQRNQDTPSRDTPNHNDRVADANELNAIQEQAAAKARKGFSSRRYKRRRFEQTETFRRMLHATQRSIKASLVSLHKAGTITQRELELLSTSGVRNVSDLYSEVVEHRMQPGDRDVLVQVRERLASAVVERLVVARQRLDG